MSKCDIVVELDRPNDALAAGDQVTGKVVLTPDGNLDLKELVIEQIWETHGRGNRDQGQLGRKVEMGRWCMAGGNYSFPFQFDTPRYPLTYHGTLINVDHYITARADVPWKVDPRAKTDYLVVPGPGSREAAIAAHRGENQQQTQAGGGAKMLRWLLAPLVLVLVLMISVMVLVLLVVLLPIVLIVGLVKLVRRSAAERKLGKVAVEISAEQLVEKDEMGRPKKQHGAFAKLRERFAGLKTQTFVAAPDMTVPVTIRFKPRSAVDVNEITLVLTATEKATSGTGTNSRTHTETLVEERTQLLGAKRLVGGSHVELRGEVRLPALVAWTFKAPDNRVSWSLVLRVDIPRSPDWLQDYALVVAPQA